MEAGKDSTEGGGEEKKVPPTVITVDTSGNNNNTAAATSGDEAPIKTDASTARTPKHANKDEKNKDEKPPAFAYYQSSYPAGMPHDARPGYRMPAMPQVSPGSQRYYQYQRFAPPPPHFEPPPFGGGNFRPPPFAAGGGPQFGAGGPPPHNGPGGPYYESAGPSWGPPPSFPHGRPPAYPPAAAGGGDYRAPPPGLTSAGSNTSFSRAVSSSFDRSIKDKKIVDDDNHSVNDASWGALNQVTSVDEEEMRKRLEKRSTPTQDKELDVERNHSNSNSSSLTNSPTEGVEGKKKHHHSSLDSLSSVASAQIPMLETKDHRKSTLSPSGSAGSLDLMKCASGSSALLLPKHHDDPFSFSAAMAGKRGHDDEEREDAPETSDETELRKAPSDDGRPKKQRKTNKDKSSPLSIDCSPPTSPSGKNRKSDAKAKASHAMFGSGAGIDAPTSIESFYDKAPSYAYSLESAPHIPAAAQPPRPSSSSSTMTPMHVDGQTELRPQPPVQQLPSWEIAPQDSFGGHSATNNGPPLMSSFSFSQDYPMLGTSASADQAHAPSHQHLLESRNQSFDGHYPGNFARSDSMMSYEGHPSSFGERTGYHGSFPPHAPSWGSTSSYPQGPPGYGQYSNYPPPMMRNFSEDSGARNTPPPNMRMLHRFQPPPEFRAPPPMVKGVPPQPQHILSSPYNGSREGSKASAGSGQGGSYGWSKEEDMRLTEVMKKYKNPRDWEPIAKEHNCNRTYVGNVLFATRIMDTILTSLL